MKVPNKEGLGFQIKWGIASPGPFSAFRGCPFEEQDRRSGLRGGWKKRMESHLRIKPRSRATLISAAALWTFNLVMIL